MALQPRDLVALALTGELATDGTHAAATLAYDLRAGTWSDGLLEALGLPASLLPRIRPPWEPLGHSGRSWHRGSDSLSRRRSSSGAPIHRRARWAPASSRPGPVSEMAGSSTCLNAVVREPMDVALVTNYPHVIPGPFTTETGINTSGAAVAWVADLLYGGTRGRATAADYLSLDREVHATPRGADGVLAAAGPGRRRADGRGSSRCRQRAVAAARSGGAGAGVPGGRRLRDPPAARAPPPGRCGGHGAAHLGRRYPPDGLEPDQGRRHRACP